VIDAAVLGLLAILLVKEAGVPLPVPGDLLVIGAGVAAAGGVAAGAPATSGLPAPMLLAAILIVGFVGGSLQFLLVRGAFRRPITALLARFGVGPERLEGLADWLRRRGVRGVAVARATPGLRVGAISASGIAALPYPVFLAGLIVGNTLFVSAHFVLGYVIGPAAASVVAAAGGAAIAIVAVVVLAALGAAGWRALQRRRSARISQVTPVTLEPAGYAAWTEAACPACLAISLVERVA
jgi:membrane protein DedA with SNARE-associated domain